LSAEHFVFEFEPALTFGVAKNSIFTGKIPSLNGWRAIAISLVMLDHIKYAAGFPYQQLHGWSLILFEQGNLGVRIFFVLSGFLITHLLLEEGEQEGSISLKNFYLRRCLRILPVYFTYLAVLACLIRLNIYGGETRSAWVGALTFSRNMIGPDTSYTGHFWSLAVEEQFYLTWPICLGALALWRRPQWAFGVLATLIALGPLVRMFGFTPEANGELLGRVFGDRSLFIYIDSLAIGCLGAFSLRRLPIQVTKKTALIVLAAALMTIVLGAWLGNVYPDTRIVSMCIPTIQAAAVLVAMWVSTQRESSIAYSILNWPPINTLGILSYSIYIWHILFLSNATGSLLYTFLYNWHTWGIASLLAAILSYYCIERPALNLNKRFSINRNASAPQYQTNLPSAGERIIPEPIRKTPEE
jgi:peptidoglycan/LPS O-acetylase OafA/YrhL